LAAIRFDEKCFIVCLGNYNKRHLSLFIL
jgi:hypothetical protein